MRAWLLLVPALAGCEPAPTVAPAVEDPVHVPYPEDLWDAGVQGETVLRVFVRADGAPDSLRVHRSSGHRGFDQAAQAGVAALTFAPGRRGSEPTGMWVHIPVQFRLQPDST